MREGLKLPKWLVGMSGITPAYAGRTENNWQKQAEAWDHPRLCGKDNNFLLFLFRASGSPPLMREGQDDILTIPEDVGITPAYAGRTEMGWLFLPGMRDHPRLCGKDPSTILTALDNSGSPPLMREGHLITFAKNSSSGITPAYAGRTD